MSNGLVALYPIGGFLGAASASPWKFDLDGILCHPRANVWT